MRILIVDDDYVSRSKLKALLSEYGDCDVAPNGKIAIDLFFSAHEESLPYTLITMDVELGEVKGQEIVRQIREWETQNNVHLKSAESKILMVTVMKDAQTIMSSFLKGCEGYLTKPFNAVSLRDSLAKIGIAKET